ncbi:MAG: hypothetical protein ACXQS6_04805 [Candidatus Syntropharchaeales archaeon]
MRRIRPIVVLALGILLVTSLLPLVSGSEESNKTFFEEVDEWKDAYNGYIGNLPKFLQHLDGRERINCEISMSNGGTTTIGVIFSGPRITHLQEGALDKPSATVWMSEDTMREIVKSGSPVEAVAEALKNGDITYQAHGWLKKIKYELLKQMIVRLIA